jgi:anti-sigma regulatory factor (Ser/Thr protein kinase)
VKPEPVSRGRIVVAHPERKAQRALQRLLGATRCQVEVVADAGALAAALDEATLAIVDVGLAAQHADLRATAARAWIAVPADGEAPAGAASVAALLAAGWDHVVAQPMPLLGEELLATVQKLRRADVFGLEKYVAWGAEVRSHALGDARDREAAVAELARDVVAVGLPERIASVASVIADELIANAIYAAPVDGHGARPHAQDSRDQARALTGRDAVTVRWATDARYLAIEVRDHWGSLDVKDVSRQLAAGGNQVSASGGGMGLPLAYACSNQLVIDVEPNRLTEVIALLDTRYKPTELARSASFHAFTAS